MELSLSPETESLAEEIAEITGESKDEAIRKALEERKLHLVLSPGPEPEGTVEDWIRLLEEKIWSKIPPELRGRWCREGQADFVEHDASRASSRRKAGNNGALAGKDARWSRA